MLEQLGLSLLLDRGAPTGKESSLLVTRSCIVLITMPPIQLKDEGKRFLCALRCATPAGLSWSAVLDELLEANGLDRDSLQ
jgi:hypothetical protein